MYKRQIQSPQVKRQIQFAPLAFIKVNLEFGFSLEQAWSLHMYMDWFYYLICSLDLALSAGSGAWFPIKVTFTDILMVGVFRYGLILLENRYFICSSQNLYCHIWQHINSQFNYCRLTAFSSHHFDFCVLA
jgi:hypothetical protein